MIASRLLLLTMAALGLLGAHQVSYERLAQGAGEHAGMTLASQSWLPGLPAILVTLSVAALLVVLHGRRSRRVVPGPFAVLALQSVLFLVLTVVDRLLHGCCVLPDASYLAFALALQVPAALCAWVLTRFGVVPVVARVVVALASLVPLQAVPVSSPALRVTRRVPGTWQLRAIARSVPRRGPPSLLLAV